MCKLLGMYTHSVGGYRVNSEMYSLYTALNELFSHVCVLTFSHIPSVISLTSASIAYIMVINISDLFQLPELITYPLLCLNSLNRSIATLYIQI